MRRGTRRQLGHGRPRYQEPECQQDLEHLAPERLAKSMIEKEKRILSLMSEIGAELSKSRSLLNGRGRG
jgi:hypothetical protein